MPYAVRHGKIVRDAKRPTYTVKEEGMLALAQAITGQAAELFGPEPPEGFTLEQIDQAAERLPAELRVLWATARHLYRAPV